MKLGWLSDIHLNFLDKPGVRRFFRQLASCEVDGWLLGGDIGEAKSIAGYLRLFETELPCRTYFVLGNHDFYGGSLDEVQAEMRRLTRQSDRLVWLTESGPQGLDGGVVIVGDDGWADGRFGNAQRTPVALNDFHMIEELVGLTRTALVQTLNTRGDQAAARLAPKLAAAAAISRQVVVVTHVPPFREAAWHEGRPSNDDWVPWFACKATGEAIMACARACPRTTFIVLCGHTHGAGVYTPAPNVMVHTAGAEYGTPGVQRVFEFEATLQHGQEGLP
jgi:predicted phosphohydrolase